MATNTSRLGLLKKDTTTDGNDTFNIKTMLNDNWDKIDGKVATLGADGKVPADQLSIVAPADASTTQKGVVQLEDSVTSTSITKAATPNSVKQVNDALTSHQTDLAYQKASGTATAITLTTATLSDGYAKTFIASANNNGSATTINGKPLYKPNTTTAPTLIAGKSYTVWYNQSSDCFFIKASAEGNATVDKVLAGFTFSNDTDNGLLGAIPSKGAQTYTPGTSNQTIAAGQFLSENQTILGDTDLIAANIKLGINIFGVNGTLDFSKTASGTATSVSNSFQTTLPSGNPGIYSSKLTISGIGFIPKFLIATKVNDANDSYVTMYIGTGLGYYNTTMFCFGILTNTQNAGAISTAKQDSEYYVNGSAASLPTSAGNASFKWWAIG